MKPTVSNLVATLLLTVVTVGIVSAPRTADACQPLQEGIFVYENIAFEQSLPTNGAWAFRATFEHASLDDLSVEVHDESDNLVDGSLVEIVERGYDLGTPNEWSQRLIIWTPTESLLPDHLYSISLRAAAPGFPSELTLDEQTTFRTTAGPQTNLEVATTNDFPVHRVHESQGAFECCHDLTFCVPCGGCSNCWPTQNIYQYAVDIEVHLPANDADRQTYHRLETSSGSFETFWGQHGIQSLSMLFPEGDSSFHCVTLKTFALATQELLEEDEKCFGASELPASTPIEGLTRPETCEDEPDAGGSDAGLQDTTSSIPDITNNTDTGPGADASAPDASSPDLGTTPPEIGSDLDRGCGCSATPNAPSSLLGMMLFFFALGASRLSLFSRKN